MRHAFDQSQAGKLPYVVALVCFADAPGIRLVANIEGVAEADLRIGLPVRLMPPADGQPLTRPVFGPLRAGQASLA